MTEERIDVEESGEDTVETEETKESITPPETPSDLDAEDSGDEKN